MTSPPDSGAPTPIVTTAHRTIVGVDVEGFGQHHRNDTNRLHIRQGVYAATERAFDAAGIPWDRCGYKDLGDGVVVLAPADIPKTRFVDELPGILAEELRRHNVTHPRAEKVRLRLAIHAGEVSYDEHGFTGASVIHAFRLLNSSAIKATLVGKGALLAIISSAWFFDEVVRHSENSSATTYRRADVTNKETTTHAWIRLIPARRRLRAPAPY
jgi:hypothetical protein